MDRYYKSNGQYVEEITIAQIKADVVEEYLDRMLKYKRRNELTENAIKSIAEDIISETESE